MSFSAYDCDRRNRFGSAPLHIAASLGDDALNTLLQLGADVEAKNRARETPLALDARGQDSGKGIRQKQPVQS